MGYIKLFWLVTGSFFIFLGLGFLTAWCGRGSLNVTFLLTGFFPLDFLLGFRSFVLVDEELEGVEGGLFVFLPLAEMFFFLSWVELPVPASMGGVAVKYRRCVLY